MTMAKTLPKALRHLILEVQQETKILNVHELAEEILSRLSAEEKVEYFAQILPSFISTALSDNSPLVSPKKYESVHPGIKKKGQNKFFAWLDRPMNSGLEVGQNVYWPDFSLDMADAKIDLMTKRINTSMNTRAKYELIRTTLKKHEVKLIKELPEGARTALEVEISVLGGFDPAEI